MSTACVILSLIMATAWIFQKLRRNAGWADLFWSYGIGIAGWAVIWPLQGPRHWLVGGVLALWSVRLGSAIGLRNWGAPEDARYAAFRGEWGNRYEITMFLFLQLQALAAWPLLWGIGAAAANPGRLSGYDGLGLAVALIALVGEATADAQLQHFRQRHPPHSLCDQGLWRYSRHPNYFFEFLGWCALPFFALADGASVTLLIACLPALTIYLLLVHVSGIPPLERHMLASRGEVFRAYQARTSAFFPLPPRHHPVLESPP